MPLLDVVAIVDGKHSSHSVCKNSSSLLTFHPCHIFAPLVSLGSSSSVLVAAEMVTCSPASEQLYAPLWPFPFKTGCGFHYETVCPWDCFSATDTGREQ